MTQLTATILIADRDDYTRHRLKSLLELKGLEVLEAHDGQEAIDMVVGMRPDLVLIQLRLPVVSGFTAIRRIRKHCELRTVPIIAVSVNKPTSNRNLALAAGCIAHVEDPGEFYLLDALIDRLLPEKCIPLSSHLVQ
jgi:two-component system, cell cycle response regulator DivK